MPALADDPGRHDHARRIISSCRARCRCPAGVKVELVVKNEQAVNAEFESTVLHREKIVKAGGQISVFVGPLDPGSYEFFDDFHNATRGHLVAK